MEVTRLKTAAGAVVEVVEVVVVEVAVVVNLRLAAVVAVKLEEPGLSRYVTAIAAAVLKRSQSPLLSRICLGRKHWASESR
jgi:hypothetical protein